MFYQTGAMGFEPHHPYLLRHTHINVASSFSIWTYDVSHHAGTPETNNGVGYYTGCTTSTMLYPPFVDQAKGPVHCVLTSTTETPLGDKQRYSPTTEIANLVHDG